MMVAPTSEPIRILFVEDLDYEAEISLTQLTRAGLSCLSRRVETEAELRRALDEFDPTVILSDFSLPQFDGLSALRIAHEVAPDVPFVFVSGTIGEDRAIEALHRGAVDYVLKNNLARLAPAVRRALEEAATRRERAQQEAQIARLNRVLRMMSGVNALVVRIRDRTELLRETCRLAVSIGGYSTAVVSYKEPGQPFISPVAWSGSDEGLTEIFRTVILESGARSTSIIARVMRSGEAFVCNDTVDLEATAAFSSLLIHAGLRSLVALPLLVDNTTMGVLVLTARDSGIVSDEELAMLREVAGNLSFALQYLQQDTRVRFLSHFDSQTGLAKRSLFCERVSRVLAEAESRQSRYALAVIDIEQLSLINDSFGRRTGDLLLQHVADRLKRRFPQTENVGHFGGGTFALLRDVGTKSDADLMNAAQDHALALFGNPFVIERREIPVSVRSGIAMFPEHGSDANTLVQNAEAALYDARASSVRQLRYSPQKHSEMVGRLALEHKLRVALERKQYELHYQPKVNVVTRRIEGVEALLRWRNPDAGLVSPATFLPLLESTGLIIDVGDWVIQQAALDCQEWLRQGLPPLRVAVNVSPSQLRLPEFATGFLRALDGWATHDAGLDVEITEGALHEDAAADVSKLRMLRNVGVRIAIDDFGTGYSSLSRLSAMPIDTLKIDRCFVQPLAEDASGRLMVKTIVALARGLNLTTVAEGVETQEQLNFLWQINCHQSQGYLHSRPVTSTQLMHLLRHGQGELLLPAEHVANEPA